MNPDKVQIESCTFNQVYLSYTHFHAAGRGRISYDDMSAGDIRELNDLARRFLSGEADLEDIPVDP